MASRWASAPVAKKATAHGATSCTEPRSAPLGLFPPLRLFNGTPIREPTPCAPAPRWGKRSEQNRADREAELPNATSPAADAEVIRAKEQGMSIAEAELPPGYPFHVRTTLPREPCASAPVATSVALPPIVPHTSGGDAVKSGGPVPGGGVVRGELVYMRDSTRGIVVVRR